MNSAFKFLLRRQISYAEAILIIFITQAAIIYDNPWIWMIYIPIGILGEIGAMRVDKLERESYTHTKDIK